MEVLVGQLTIKIRAPSTRSDAKAPRIKPGSGLRLRGSVCSDRLAAMVDRSVCFQDSNDEPPSRFREAQSQRHIWACSRSTTAARLEARVPDPPLRGPSERVRPQQGTVRIG